MNRQRFVLNLIWFAAVPLVFGLGVMGLLFPQRIGVAGLLLFTVTALIMVIWTFVGFDEKGQPK